MFGRIRLSLTAWYVGVLLVIVLAMAGFTYVLFYRSLESEVDDSLRDSAQAIVSQLDEHALERAVSLSGDPGRSDGEEDDAENEEHEEGLRFFGGGAGDTFYLILGPDGQTLLNPLNVRLEGAPDVAAAQAAASGGEAWSTIRGDDAGYRLYSLPVVDDGRTLAVVQVGRSLEEHEQQLRTLLLVLAVSGTSGLALAGAGGLWVAGRALRPVREAFQRQHAFVADASHELRTPLTLVRGNAEMLGMSPTAKLAGEDRQFVEGIVREAEHIERLISDLSTLARMDEGHLALQVEPVNVAGLIDEVARQGRILAGGRRLDVQAESETPLEAMADPARLRQLLLALVENAVRYTPDDGRVEIEGKRAGGGVEIRVSDTGHGIPPEHLPRVFERFYRADQSRSRARGGTGLGLSIARGIAEAHGGALTVASEPGRGTEFTLSLPVQR